jgi:hypothetical protein
VRIWPNTVSARVEVFNRVWGGIKKSTIARFDVDYSPV